MLTTIIRIFLPRRKQLTLNFLLFLVLLALLSFIGIREWRTKVVMLPLAEGRTWPAEDYLNLVLSDVNNTGLGEMGKAVILEGTDKLLEEQHMKEWFMNVAASNKISLNRTLPDVRMAECRSVVYKDLPKASVVIIFTDEAWTPLLRTVHSVLNRSPPALLEEVLLIDDFSQRKNFKEELDTYLKRFGEKVRIIHLKRREGLIRAKLFGAESAKGEVVVFLDSHCEANHGWLEPLLHRIKQKRSAVVCPAIDHISASTFQYTASEQINSVGGFWWSLHFRWDPISQDVLKRRTSKTDAIPSPTMAGGLFAANRKYFLEVGGYDPGMDIWDGENLEISFRVWMCGGSIEFIPCSHVGHVFRNGHPYNMTGPNGNKDVHGTNSKRLAEVWMDDYKRFYYMHRKDLKTKDVGNLTDRIELRKRLNCKNFKWYLDNVIPHKFVPDENVVGYGAFRNLETGLCLDTLQKDENSKIPIGLFSCQSGGSSAQRFSLTKTGEFRRELSCAKVEAKSSKMRDMFGVLVYCSTSADDQKWAWDENGLMRHVQSGLCMDVSGGAKSGDKAVPMRKCDSGSSYQKWEFV